MLVVSSGAVKVLDNNLAILTSRIVSRRQGSSTDQSGTDSVIGACSRSCKAMTGGVIVMKI